MGEMIEVVGTVEKVIFRSGEDGFVIFSVKLNSSNEIIAKGYLPSLQEGAKVTLNGSWQFNPKYGRQFDVKDCTTNLPNSAAGIEKYLASGMIKGIGAKFAQRIVKKFGEQTLEIIDSDPEKLYEVEGVGQKRIAQIATAWKEQKEISQVMVFLRSKDVSASFAVKIYKAYGNDSIQKIQQNPYQLVDDIWGIGFKSADKIALKLGLASDSIERIKAAFVFSISEVSNNGHLYVELDESKKKVIELLELDESIAQERLKKALYDLYAQDKIKLISYQDKHFITLPKFYYSEKGIAKRVNYLLEYKAAHDSNRDFDYAFDIDKIYNKMRVPAGLGIELNDDQQRGILTCLQNKITIITGGPGTGKTTLVKNFIKIWFGLLMAHD